MNMPNKIKLKHIRKKIKESGDELLINRARQVIDQFNQKPTNKNLMVLIGKIKAICLAGMHDPVFNEKYNSGYKLEVRRIMSKLENKVEFDWWPDK